jgi:hypothetical protein
MKRNCWNLIWVLSVGLMLFTACGDQQQFLPAGAALQVEPLYGSSLAQVEVEQSGPVVTVRLAQASPAGTYLRLFAPAGTEFGQAVLDCSDGVIGLVAPQAGHADLALVATPQYSGQPVAFELQLVEPGKQASVPPVGTENVLTDFAITEAGAGQVELSWTQVNAGDYDFDGEVSARDLQPIAALFGQTYDRQSTGADQTTVYWVDGTGDGEIGAQDITPIAVNFNATITGYNLYHNGALIPGAQAGQPSVPAAQRILRANLPPRYLLVMPGVTADAWSAVAVDAAGVEGSGGGTGGGIVGDVNLRAGISFSGVDLFDLTGGNPGAFTPGKIGSRVIDPIEIIGTPHYAAAPKAIPQSSTSQTLAFPAVPQGKLLYLDLFYSPTVNLATGQSKGGASVKSVSATPTAESVITSIPFRIPAGVGNVVEITANLTVAPNPAGGYFVNVESSIAMPGDNPGTPAVEDGYVLAGQSRLAFATGEVSRDTDGNGDFEDEAHLEDSDRDGVSDNRLEQEFDDDDPEYDEQSEVEVEGTVVSFDEAAGTITLTNAQLKSGSLETPLPSPVTVKFSELTRFEERVRTDSGDEEHDLDPSSLVAGDEVELSMYALEDLNGGLPAIYWIEEIKRVIDLRT